MTKIVHNCFLCLSAAGLLSVTNLSSCAEHDDCRPQVGSADASLAQALGGASFLLQSYQSAGSPVVAAVHGLGPNGDSASLSLLADGTFFAYSGVNRSGAAVKPARDSEPSRFFVQDQKLNFCGPTGSTQLTSNSPELKAQDEVFTRVIFGGAAITVQGQDLLLSTADGSALRFRRAADAHQ